MYPRLQCREPAPKKNQDCIYDYFINNNNKFGSTNHWIKSLKTCLVCLLFNNKIK